MLTLAEIMLNRWSTREVSRFCSSFAKQNKGLTRFMIPWPPKQRMLVSGVLDGVLMITYCQSTTHVYLFRRMDATHWSFTHSRAAPTLFIFQLCILPAPSPFPPPPVEPTYFLTRILVISLVNLCLHSGLARSTSGERLLSSSSSSSSALLAGENSAPEVERSASGTALARGIPVPKGLEGMQARDPGSPPPIFLVITPSPRSDTTPNLFVVLWEAVRVAKRLALL